VKIAAERDAEEPNSPRWLALQEIFEAITDEQLDRYQRLREEYDPILAQLQEAYDAADRRYTERYGESVSVLTPDCPPAVGTPLLALGVLTPTRSI
jgi:hypothetical protein